MAFPEQGQGYWDLVLEDKQIQLPPTLFLLSFHYEIFIVDYFSEFFVNSEVKKSVWG